MWGAGVLEERLRFFVLEVTWVFVLTALFFGEKCFWILCWFFHISYWAGSICAVTYEPVGVSVMMGIFSIWTAQCGGQHLHEAIEYLECD